VKHTIDTTPSGAVCSCGRVFSVWKTKRGPTWMASHDAGRTKNLVRANAYRHADGANRKEAK